MMSDDAIDGFVRLAVAIGSDPPSPLPSVPSTTAEMLAAMLTENTGRHMLDSGGAYGRSWERHRREAGWTDREPSPAELAAYFGSRPEVMVDAHFHDVTIDVFHWLLERLEYRPDLDAEFHAWARESTGYWLEDMEQWPEDRGGEGLYGDGKPFTVNTYNGECALSETLQFTYWEEDAGAFVLLQIHGGADVRGGYTDPRVFEIIGDEGTDILDYCRFSAVCEGRPSSTSPMFADREHVPDTEPHQWYSDDTCNLYSDDSGESAKVYDLAGLDAEGNLTDDDPVALACPTCQTALTFYTY